MCPVPDHTKFRCYVAWTGYRETELLLWVLTCIRPTESVILELFEVSAITRGKGRLNKE